MSKLKFLSIDKFVEGIGEGINSLPDPKVLSKSVGGKGDIRCIVNNNRTVIGIAFGNIDVWNMFCSEVGMLGDAEELWFGMEWVDTQN